MTIEILITTGLAIVAFFTMALFGILHRGKPPDPEINHRHVSFLVSTFLHGWFLWLFNPVTKALVRLNIRPDVLNIAGILSSALAGFAFAKGMIPTGGWLILLCGIFDVLDGKVARQSGKVSRYGAFMDSTLDRYAEIFLFLGLVIYFRDSLSMVLGVVIALSGSLMVSYTKARGESLGVNCKEGLMQRPERLIYLGAGAILTPPFDMLLNAFGIASSAYLLGFVIWAIAFLATLTSFYRFFYIIRALKETP